MKHKLKYNSAGLLLFTTLIIFTCIFLYKSKDHLPHSWDGSGHQTIAHIYSQNIFPSINGWNNQYFGGLPFPNFYPPVFYWVIGSLSHIFSFETAFNFIVILPIFLLPFIIWNLIYSLTDNNQIASWTGAIGSLFLLLDARFIFSLPAGLDFFSTFQIGLYTQPLGFVFLLLWYVTFQKTVGFGWRFSMATILLALTVLSNFFTGAAAVLMATIVIAEDIFLWYKSQSKENKAEEMKQDIENFQSNNSKKSRF